MRRRTDKIAVVCAVLCALCTVVTVVFVAPTVLDTKTRVDDNAALARQLKALGVRTSLYARDTRYALCTLRNDLEVRATTSREFLRTHPEGIPGVPVKSLRDSLANQERTIAALSSLDC